VRLWRSARSRPRSCADPGAITGKPWFPYRRSPHPRHFCVSARPTRLRTRAIGYPWLHERQSTGPDPNAQQTHGAAPRLGRRGKSVEKPPQW